MGDFETEVRSCLFNLNNVFQFCKTIKLTYKPNSWQYLPFNGGPRICIGQQFALTEAAFTTVRLLQAFKGVEARDDAPFTDFLTLTAAVRGGVKVVMIPA